MKLTDDELLRWLVHEYMPPIDRDQALAIIDRLTAQAPTRLLTEGQDEVGESGFEKMQREEWAKLDDKVDHWTRDDCVYALLLWSNALKSLRRAKSLNSHVPQAPVVDEETLKAAIYKALLSYRNTIGEEALPMVWQDLFDAVTGLLHPAPTWQTMETAPRDGTVIRGGHWMDSAHFEQTDCWWGHKDHNCGEAGSFCDASWHENTEGEQDDMWRCTVLHEPVTVTHWQPLPTPPAALISGRVK